ncbi:nurim isoform X1 [Bombina bombina]|uniref:nurim isoform X1 n=1 Tax=Bombina bombina TaxID=8345 RepID=UPI00235ABD8C|nr:nurim isoform X1 [Bombina bombina]
MSAGSQDVAPSLPTCLALASVSLMCFVAGFGTGAEFVRFLSFGTIFKNFSGGLEGDLPPLSWREAVGDTQVYRALGIDAALLILFVLQHSVMAWPSVKGAVTQVFGVLNRSLYILCTAISLQALMYYWQQCHRGPYLWSASSDQWNLWLPLICALLHTVSWLLIFSVLLIFDYAELMGIKQVYYHCFGMGDPLSHKAPRVARLYAHLRHPIYLELLVIMWAVPALSPDRLLLSSFLTLYLSLVHRLDVQDYTYLSSQLEKKFLLFSREEENGRGELWKKE